MLSCCVEEENKKSQQVLLRFAVLNSFSTQTSDRGIQKLTAQKFIQDLEIRSMAYSFNVWISRPPEGCEYFRIIYLNVILLFII